MKWLYRILRLFLCPHKYIVYSEIHEFNTELSTDRPVGHIKVLRCQRCGKFRNHRT